MLGNVISVSSTSHRLCLNDMEMCENIHHDTCPQHRGLRGPEMGRQMRDYLSIGPGWEMRGEADE